MAIKDGIVQEVGTHDQLMERHGLYHSLVVATLSNEEEDEKEDVVDELEVMDYSLPSLASMTNYSLHTWQGRKNSKRTVERKISVSSIMSDDSFSMDHLEEAGAAIGAVVGISKVSSSLRESRRRKSLSRYLKLLCASIAAVFLFLKIEPLSGLQGNMQSVILSEKKA